MRAIIMPKLSPTMEAGTIVRWLKREGDVVEAGEILFEVETDKAVNEVETSDSGTLGKILVDEGEATDVLQVIAYILEPGEDAPDEWPLQEPSLPPAGSGSTTVPSEPKATPVAKRIAIEHGIDLGHIRGTGEGGQITKEDVLRLVQESQQPSAGPRRPRRTSPRAKRLAQEKGVSLDQIQGSGPGGRIMEQDVLDYVDSQNVALPSRLRKITAERMSQSFATAPHFYLKVEANASRLVEWRARLLPIIGRTSGVRLTFTDLFVFLVAQTLRNHPRVNASWDDGRIRTFGEINIGLALAVEGGLTVPVLKRADRKGIEEIAQEREALIEKAAIGALSLDDLESGTFTLTNLGMWDIDEFAAIINPPQSAILAVGRIAERAVAQDGQAVVKPTVHLVLSVDHRVLDGADGARFLGDLKRAIEDPDGIFEASVAGMILG
jgi:pyruvate dehydrogenase E2 component (dihydrolipoamide acetyltransferase)